MKSKRVLVTGSSRGIGRSIAVKLAESGWSVAVHYSGSEDEAQATVHALGAAATGCYRADLTQPEQAKKLFATALSDGPIHAIVNNAGTYIPMDLMKATDAQFDATFYKTFALNFESPIRLIRLAAKHFGGVGGGKIVNVCSRVGFKGESGAALYAASKAALINVTRSLAMELAPQNIQLYGIAPGWVDTAMTRDGMDERLPTILKDIPVGRMASPEDCAGVTRFLLSDESNYLSGVVIDINGASYFH